MSRLKQVLFSESLMSAMLKPVLLPLAMVMAASSVFAETAAEAEVTAEQESTALVRESSPLGETVEKQLPLFIEPTPWVQDDSIYEANQGDRIEIQQVQEQHVRTIKLPNVVPPIYFESGVAAIPESYVEKIRDVLESMRDRRNVRLHLVGHSDNVPLFGALKEQYGDNTGLSRERAGTTAEYFQQALRLPPESISYEGMGESQPIASNVTPEGKARNRRVEVEVWYDEIDEKTVEKEVVISQRLSRLKICRIETVCKLTYKEGHARRTRVKNLVPPLHFSEESAQIPPEFQAHIRQALTNLEGKQNVVVKLIGYTDDLPLMGRDARIYGNHASLSKARARRAALALQDALGLPSSMIDSDGRGASNPVASNETEAGRALNRRIETEFWYDDPLQELPDEPQFCPESAAAETVTRLYNPPTGAIRPVLFDGGQPQIADVYVDRMAGLLAEVADKSNVRLRFIGYTNNQRLDRRTAMVYGDDIGLSTARARRVMEIFRERLQLEEDQVEFEGRGYVQTDDVVNAGFVEMDTSRVEIRIVYDELAVMDDLDAVDIQRLTREIDVANPYALNLMRITVDGQSIDDPKVGVPDVERCTDVALENADVQFRYDNLERKPRLNVTAWPNTIRYRDDIETVPADNLVQFRLYSNYPAFIEKAEVRIFDEGTSLRDAPLAIVGMDAGGRAEWAAEFDSHEAPGRTLRYVVRVYDSEGRYDETAEQALRVVDQLDPVAEDTDPEAELLVGYGENRLRQSNIPLKGGTVKVYGSSIPEQKQVWVAGRAVPVSADGEFVVEEILPDGIHTVEVAVVDEVGNGELFLRDLEFEKSDWFYVGIADVTASANDTSGPAELMAPDKGHYDDDLSIDGRLAYYVKGKFGEGWQLTSSADTLEGPVEDLFTNFMQKTPDAMFRRIDPDYYYPTYGDDSTVEEDAPTLGKFYLKLSQRDNYGMWGNFRVDYTDNSLAHIDRTLFGANLHLQSDAVTSFGEKRFMIDGFAADPGTIAGRDEFLGTGGSLYFLRHQDVLNGSERVRIEVRDKVSGVVVAVKNLVPSLDYDIDYLQGRIVLTEPLSPTSADGLLVASEAGSGNQAYLVTRYEYSSSFEDVGNLWGGGRVHYWLGDYVKIGLTADNGNEAGTSGVQAGDITLRKSADTWLKAELSGSEGTNSTTFLSSDGGYNFGFADNGALPGEEQTIEADAARVEASLDLADAHSSLSGKLTLYHQNVDAGYSAPGLITAKDTEQVGAALQLPVTDNVDMRIKYDQSEQVLGLDNTAAELNADYRLDQHWTLSTGVRQENREDNSPVVPLTQIEGDRTDAVLRAGYDSRGRWTAYGYVQDTVESSGNQEDNGRVGAGGSYRFSDRFSANGEASAGDFGDGGKVGSEYLLSDRTTLYANYTLENERTDNGLRAQRGNMSSGFRTRYSDSVSVYLEEVYTHGDVPTGLTHATGVDLAPNDRWNFGANLDVGTLRDNLTSAEMDRIAVGLRVGYGFEAIKVYSAFEYRIDDRENADLTRTERKTWLTKNSLKYQMSEQWRLIGKLNFSDSQSSMGEFYDGRYIEAVMGYGYRPIYHDRLDTLFKYTYFYNLPSADQVTINNTAAEYIQKSHILAIDTIYDLTRRWSIGGKYAYRLGQLSQDRVNPQFFDSRASLYIARADWHVVRHWDAVIEARMLELQDAGDTRSGMLTALYRHLGDHVKLGVGYNFSDFSDDLTNLSYDHQGLFINLVGKI